VICAVWFKLKKRIIRSLIVIDEQKIFEVIEQRKPASVALNGPDGILPHVQETSAKIMKRFGIPSYVIADTTWGSCDLNSNGAKVLAAEILFNIGHTISMQSLDNVIFIDAFDDVAFDSVTEKCAEILKGTTVSLVTDSQHLNQIDSVKKILEGSGVTVKVGKGKGQLNDGQVFGCEFYPALEVKDHVDANVFMGQSNFHAAGLALATNKPTYVLDPYFNEVREVTEFAQKIQKKATLAIYKAADAKTFGIIVGLKEGQISKTAALKFKRELEKEGKTVQLFALTDITNERLRNLRGIDAFIQVACPRISTDNQFDKPVLSTPQANALLKILRNENMDGYLQIPHWL
jgi:2-(3-amino-3-carboxypropyl)histidine synthase